VRDSRPSRLRSRSKRPRMARGIVKVQCPKSAARLAWQLEQTPRARQLKARRCSLLQAGQRIRRSLLGAGRRRETARHSGARPAVAVPSGARSAPRRPGHNCRSVARTLDRKLVFPDGELGKRPAGRRRAGAELNEVESPHSTATSSARVARQRAMVGTRPAAAARPWQIVTPRRRAAPRVSDESSAPYESSAP